MVLPCRLLEGSSPIEVGITAFQRQLNLVYFLTFKYTGGHLNPTAANLNLG